MDLVCPNTPRMSSSSRGLRVRALMLGGIELSLCFEDVVLGFGANLVTALVFIVLQATKRSRRRVTVTEAPLKRLLHVLPSVGVCLSTYDVVLLIRKSLQGHAPEYHKWLFSGSQLVSWMMVMLSLKCEYHKVFFYNGIFCFWWIVKTLLLIPRLSTIFSSSEAIVCVEVGLSFINELIFGLLVNWVRLMSSHNDGRAFNHLDEALLPHDMEKNDDHSKEDGWDFHGLFNLLTFQRFKLTMDIGVSRQLNFQDLVSLPSELSPSSCHVNLLKCWLNEQRKHRASPSLLKAMFSAYGWPYLLLGVIKVLNDGVGFLSPLLLNRLLRFVQQGSGHRDGYILAVSLGLVSTFKSLLDTQYSFQLNKLKLQLRSSIMTIIYHKFAVADWSCTLSFVHPS